MTIKAAREVGKGVIYVDIPSCTDAGQFELLFGKAFGKALNFTFDEDAMLTLRLKRKFFGDSDKDNNKDNGKIIISILFFIIVKSK